jgi:hypothetical protein
MKSADAPLYTSDNVKSIWKNTLQALGVQDRYNEIESVAANAQLQRFLALPERRARVASRQTLAHAETRTDVDISDYKCVALGITTHVQTIQYRVYLEKLQRANANKTLTGELVEACFYRDISTLIKITGVKEGAAASMVKQAKSVLNQAEARRHWKSSLKSSGSSEEP